MAAVILMTAASCKRDELSSGQDTQKYTFTCTIENEMPKVAISDAGKTTWEAGDQICVHGEYTPDQAIILLQMTSAQTARQPLFQSKVLLPTSAAASPALFMPPIPQVH